MNGIQDLTPQRSPFPNVGAVKLGIVNAKNNPEDRSYFVIDGELGKNAPDLVPFYGEEPKELLIWLVYGTRAENFKTDYRLRGQGGMKCMGDGDRIDYLIDPKGSRTVVRDGVVVQAFEDIGPDGETIDVARGEILRCPGKNGRDNPLYVRCRDCGIKGIHGNLHFVVRNPHKPGEPVDGRLVTYRLETGSYYSTINLMEQLDSIARICNMAGRSMAWVPLILRRVPGKVSIPGKNREGQDARMQVEKYFLQVEIDPAAAMRIISGATNAPALPEPASSRPALGPTVTPEPAEAEYIEENGKPAQDLMEDRPWTPETCRERLREMVHYYGEDDPSMGLDLDTDAQRKLAIQWKNVFGGIAHEDKQRYAMLKFLTGQESIKKLCLADRYALEDWMKDMSNARIEASAILQMLAESAA